MTKDGWFVQPYVQNGIEGFDNSKAKVRWNWESPIAFAPWDGHIGWIGANVIYQTADRGLHWKAISPDLTRNVKEHQLPAGGPLVHDVSGAEESDTILDIEGSKLRTGEIWAGTDDGLVQLTRDGGKHWKNVTPEGAPQFGRFASIAPSPIVAGTAYAINDGHYAGDNAPYVYVTHDYGSHWTKIVNGLPSGEWARAVAADIHNRNIAYLGTEEGMWISFNGGTSWEKFKNNLPTVSVHDIRMQPEFNDLVIATHGRSVYIMDDMAPVQDIQTAVARGTYLFKPRTSYQYNQRGDDEGTLTNYVANNPANGTVISFYQKSAGKNPPKLEILDSAGRVIRTYQGTHKVAEKEKPWVTNEVGINHFVWNWTIDGPVKWLGAAKERYQGANDGPAVAPGTYSARLTLDGSRPMLARFEVKADPRTIYTQAQIVRSFEFAKRGRDMFSRIDTMLNSLDTVKKQLDDASAAAKKANNTDLASKIDAIGAARKTLFTFLTADYHNDEDGIQMAGKLREDVQTIQFASGTVITPAFEDYMHRVDAELRDGISQYNEFVRTNVAALNDASKTLNLKAITVKTMEDR